MSMPEISAPSAPVTRRTSGSIEVVIVASFPIAAHWRNL